MHNFVPLLSCKYLKEYHIGPLQVTTTLERNKTFQTRERTSGTGNHRLINERSRLPPRCGVDGMLHALLHWTVLIFIDGRETFSSAPGAAGKHGHTPTSLFAKTFLFLPGVTCSIYKPVSPHFGNHPLFFPHYSWYKGQLQPHICSAGPSVSLRFQHSCLIVSVLSYSS